MFDEQLPLPQAQRLSGALKQIGLEWIHTFFDFNLSRRLIKKTIIPSACGKAAPLYLRSSEKKIIQCQSMNFKVPILVFFPILYS